MDEELYCLLCETEGHTIRTCPTRDDDYMGDFDDEEEDEEQYVTCRGGCGNAHAEKNGICSSCGYYNG